MSILKYHPSESYDDKTIKYIGRVNELVYSNSFVQFVKFRLFSRFHIVKFLKGNSPMRVCL